MPSSCRLMSAQTSFMMDVTGGVAKAGTPVEVWTANSPPSPNQLWTFEPGPDPGFFYIKSSLGPNLVLDVTGGVAKAGTPLQVWTQNSPPSPNQLWEFAPIIPGPIAEGFIRSLLSPNLVVDVTGGSTTRGTRLQVWTQNSPTSGNQIWFPLAAPSTISVSISGEEFTFTGSGWVAGTTVQVRSDFILATGNIPGGPYGVTVAPDGTFRDTISVNYFGSAGQLTVNATDANSGQSASAYALNLGG